MEKVLFKESLKEKFKDCFSGFLIEKGGIIFAKDDVVVDFIEVKNTTKNNKEYIPSFTDMNKKAQRFVEKGLSFAGIAHSHPIDINGNGSPRASNDDLDFYSNFAKTNDNFKLLLFPIVTIINGELVVNCYVYKNKQMSLEPVEWVK